MATERIGVPSDDDLLLERLSALVRELDPVPASVTVAARAAFKLRAEAHMTGVAAGAQGTGACDRPRRPGRGTTQGESHTA
jgi:hypothetical protein